MRLIFYINCLDGGGAQRVMANLANMFVQAGDEVIFVTSFPGDKEYALDPRVDRRNLSDVRTGNVLLRNISYVAKLRKLIKTEKADAILAFMAKPNFRAIIAGMGLPVKTIISVRNDPEREYTGKLNRFLAKKLLPLADGCVFQTEDAKAWFPEKLQKKSVVIANAVKADFFEVSHAPVPARVITCGRLAKQKNHKLLIDSFITATAEIPKAQLLIYGKGELKEELTQYIAEKGQSERIQLMGRTEDVPGVLSGAECFVLSSDFEGMPNALMEAMAAGVPCISTDCPCGGPKMLIEDGKSGLLVKVGNEAEMTEALRRMLSDRDFAQRIAEEGRKAAQNFEPDAIFAKWRNYISKI